MDLRDLFDGFIEDAVIHGYTPEQSSILLLDEDFHFFHEDVGRTELLETVKKRVVMRAGHRITLARRGRPNPARSIKAKQAARKGAARRRAAQRNPATKRKRKMAMRVRRSVTGSRRPRRKAAYRGYHGTKRHAGPRKAVRPKTYRPKTYRPKARRPKRPTYRRRR